MRVSCEELLVLSIYLLSLFLYISLTSLPCGLSLFPPRVSDQLQAVRVCVKLRISLRATRTSFHHCKLLLTLLTRWLISPKALDRSNRVCSIPLRVYIAQIASHVASISLTSSTAPRSPFHSGVRTSGRAFNSPNWRIKAEDSPGAQSPSSPSQRRNTPRSAFNGQNAHVPQAVAEGRRLYVGNMPYMAKTEDVQALFATGEYKMCGSPF